MSDTEQEVKGELVAYQQLETELNDLAAELSANPKFARFIEVQRAFNEYSNNVWKTIENQMIEGGIDRIDTDLVTLSIAKRANFDVDAAELPAKFWKKVPDTTKINGTFKLEGKAPKGTKVRFTQYLVKRFKNG